MKKQTESELIAGNLELHMLDRVNRLLVSPLDLESALREAVAIFQQGFDYFTCAVYRLDRDQQALAPVAVSGGHLTDTGAVVRLTDGGPISQCAVTGARVYARDAALASRPPGSEGWVGAECATPLRRGDEVIGVLAVRGGREGGFDERELAAIDSFAIQASLALTQAALYRAAAARDQLLDFYHNAPDAYFSFTPDGVITEMNEAGLRKAGYSRGEVIGKLCVGDLLAASEALTWPDFMAELAEKGEVCAEAEQVRRDGTTVPVRVNTRAVCGAAGDVLICHATARDISAEKQLLAQLIQAQKIDSVGRLAGGIAHDFNNLLTGILGFTSLAMRQLGQGHATYSSLAEVERAAKRAATLVSQLLAYSRRQLAKLEPLDLNQLVRETAGFLARTLPETIRINLRLSESVNVVKADQAQIQQVILNLCVNARDAMGDRGELTIATGDTRLDEDFTQAHLGSKPGAYVYVEVTDTGCGMDAETLQRIFEPFFTTKEVGKGTGLGLSMVYGIVKSHDGYVAAESKPGQGATFRVYLPVCGQAIKRMRARPVTARGGNETILIVEDEPLVSSLIQEVLAGYGYTVLTAANGRDAIATYRERSGGIDLVIADVVMPEVGGTELHRELKRIDPRARVLLSSGYSMSADLKAYIAQGVPFIQKPYQVEDLVRVVREILDAPADVQRDKALSLKFQG